MEKTEPRKVSGQGIAIPRRLWPEVPLRPSPLYIERMHGPRNDLPSIHDFAELICIASGNGAVTAAGRKFVAETDDVFWIPPETVHCESGRRSLDTIWIGIEREGIEVLPKRPTVVHSAQLARLIHEAWRCVRAARRLSGPELDGRVLTILGIFLQLCRTGTGKSADRNWEELFGYLQDHLAEPLEIPVLAERVDCSESYFFRRFRELAGCTPLQYLIRLRLNQVKVYLSRSDLPLAEIAQICGFDDPYYLSKSFHRYWGMSPSAFRRASRQEATAAAGADGGA